MEDKEFQQFAANIKRYTGIDLSLYKENQMNRRLRALYVKKGFADFQDYFESIKKNKTVLEEFLDRITINVTEFFRNPTRWDVVKETIFPKILKEKGTIRCWSAACSTGEEPYTMAILLNELLPFSKIKIIATDIDETALQKAKEGVYNEYALKNCSPRVLDKHFQKDNKDSYKISQEVKDSVTFKKQNLLEDDFEKNFDFIACRNVMIYFTEEAKENLYRKFNKSLNENGILFVGSTEQIFHPENYGFKIFDSFFYSKT